MRASLFGLIVISAAVSSLSASEVGVMATSSSYEPFTARVMGNRVRMRLSANVDSYIVKELGRGDMFVIDGEDNDFYSVRPSGPIHGYVYRKYVTDGLIEGTRVNIRLGPDLEAPIVGQLNSGDIVKVTGGSVGKWVEIALPDNTRFFIAKEYVERIGDEGYLARVEQRNQDAELLINSAYTRSQSELRKPFEEVDLNEAFTALDHVVADYSDVEGQSLRAQELKNLVQETYNQKRTLHLESKAASKGSMSNARSGELQKALEAYHERLSALEAKISGNDVVASSAQNALPVNKSGQAVTEILEASEENVATGTSNFWDPLEDMFYEEWQQGYGFGSKEEYYSVQKRDAIALEGVIEAYDRPVRNKPGNYVLIDPKTRTPVAFLYSTRMDLGELVGKEVKILGAPRPNNDFAYPAYYALDEAKENNT